MYTVANITRINIIFRFYHAIEKKLASKKAEPSMIILAKSSSRRHLLGTNSSLYFNDQLAVSATKININCHSPAIFDCVFFSVIQYFQRTARKTNR